MDRKLGRLPHDPEVIARAPQLTRHLMAAAPPPRILYRGDIPFTPALDDNDKLGNCTAVGYANTARAAAALEGYQIGINTEKVVHFYSESTGYVPGDPSTDNGGVEVDVLNWQARHGCDDGGQTRLVGAWGTYDPADQSLMRIAMAQCGAAYLGVSLSVSDQNMAVWDTQAPASAGDPTPGSWGLHCLIAWDYSGPNDDDLVRLGTWGTWQTATWRWVRQRTQEAHAILWRQLQSAVMPEPHGVNIEALLDEGELFAGWLAGRPSAIEA
jgi:hypothetical protein